MNAETFTEREQAVLSLIGAGATDAEIAVHLGIGRLSVLGAIRQLQIAVGATLGHRPTRGELGALYLKARGEEREKRRTEAFRRLEHALAVAPCEHDECPALVSLAKALRDWQLEANPPALEDGRE